MHKGQEKSKIRSVLFRVVCVSTRARARAYATHTRHVYTNITRNVILYYLSASLV